MEHVLVLDTLHHVVHVVLTVKLLMVTATVIQTAITMETAAKMSTALHVRNILSNYCVH